MKPLSYDDQQLSLASFVDLTPAEQKPQAEWPADLPEPGFYERVPYKTYAKWPAMNATTLLWGLKSMEHMKASIDGKLWKDSAALAFGRAFHMALLEPDLFKQSFAVAGRCEAIQKNDKRCANDGICVDDSDRWLCGVHSKSVETAIPSQIITARQLADIRAMCQKCKRHDVIKLIRQRGGYECSGTWRCNGTPFKFRLDKWVPSIPGWPQVIIDVKKIRPGFAKTELFMAREVFDEDRNYHIRAALQVDAVKAITGETPMFLWMPVEDSYPYGVNVIEAKPPTLEIGRREYAALIGKYQEALATDYWPGYSEDIDEGYPPDWIMRRYGMLR